jgi:hypothetical protein
MKLRDHPLISYRRLSNWPPVWTRYNADKTVKTLQGEVGVLAYVHSNARISNRCYLVINYGGESYVGTLIFDNQTFCKQVIELLQTNLHRTIREIGDLDLSHTL